jgi:hypothetical protein
MDRLSIRRRAGLELIHFFNNRRFAGVDNQGRALDAVNVLAFSFCLTAAQLTIGNGAPAGSALVGDRHGVLAAQRSRTL